MNKFFDLDNREKLQFLLSDGFSLTIIQKKLNIIQYVKYSPVKAIVSEIKKYVGEDSWNLVKEACYEKRDL